MRAHTRFSQQVLSVYMAKRAQAEPQGPAADQPRLPWEQPAPIVAPGAAPSASEVAAAASFPPLAPLDRRAPRASARVRQRLRAIAAATGFLGCERGPDVPGDVPAAVAERRAARLRLHRVHTAMTELRLTSTPATSHSPPTTHALSNVLASLETVGGEGGQRSTATRGASKEKCDQNRIMRAGVFAGVVVEAARSVGNDPVAAARIVSRTPTQVADVVRYALDDAIGAGLASSSILAHASTRRWRAKRGRPSAADGDATATTTPERFVGSGAEVASGEIGTASASVVGGKRQGDVGRRAEKHTALLAARAELAAWPALSDEILDALSGPAVATGGEWPVSARDFLLSCGATVPPAPPPPPPPPERPLPIAKRNAAAAAEAAHELTFGAAVVAVRTLHPALTAGQARHLVDAGVGFRTNVKPRALELFAEAMVAAAEGIGCTLRPVGDYRRGALTRDCLAFVCGCDATMEAPVLDVRLLSRRLTEAVADKGGKLALYGHATPDLSSRPANERSVSRAFSASRRRAALGTHGFRYGTLLPSPPAKLGSEPAAGALPVRVVVEYAPPELVAPLVVLRTGPPAFIEELHRISDCDAAAAAELGLPATCLRLLDDGLLECQYSAIGRHRVLRAVDVSTEHDVFARFGVEFLRPSDRSPLKVRLMGGKTKKDA